MLIGTSTGVMANEKLPQNQKLLDHVVDDSDNPAYQPETNLDVINYGNMLRKSRANYIIPGLTHYYQNSGNYWDNDNMQTENLPIWRSGCAITSFAMAISNMGYSQNPGQVNATLGTDACPFNPYQISNKYGGNITQSSSLTYGTQDQFLSFVSGQIGWATPVIVGLTLKAGSGIYTTHYVLAFGISGSNIHIYDPAYQRNYILLSQYLSNYDIYRAYTVAHSAR